MDIQQYHVVHDVTGVTGMEIIRAIVAGERNADELAKHRDGVVSPPSKLFVTR